VDFSARSLAFLADFRVDLASLRAALSFSFASFAVRLAICAAFSPCVTLAWASSNSLRALFLSDDTFMMDFSALQRDS
jgi:hypothetical protein